MAALKIIYLDEDIAIVNKLSPIPVQKDKSGDEDAQSLLASLLANREKGENSSLKSRKKAAPFLEAAHRIDRRTSGIVVFARNIASLRALEKMFRDKEVAKTYLACVEKEPSPPEARLENLLVQDKRGNRAIAKQSGDAGAPGVGGHTEFRAERAVLEYALIAKSDRYFFLSVAPETGQHHQIRAQLAAIGCPIKGDLKYGARRSNPSGKILLHAWKIEFRHPRTKAPLVLVAEPPSDEPLWNFFNSLQQFDAVEKKNE